MSRLQFIFNFRSNKIYIIESFSILVIKQRLSKERLYAFKKPFDPRWQKLLNVPKIHLPQARSRGMFNLRRTKMEGGRRKKDGSRVASLFGRYEYNSYRRLRHVQLGKSCKLFQAPWHSYRVLLIIVFIKRVLRCESASIICHRVSLFLSSTTAPPSGRLFTK